VKPEVITFIEIAKNDFEAAKILFREELYLQAIFMLQQSLEKAIKALLLKFGIVDSEKALKYEIGHNVVKNTLQLMAEIICNGRKEIQNMILQHILQYKDLLRGLQNLQLLVQKVEEYAKFACEQYIREKDYLFMLIENFKDKVFEPLNEENKKIINMAVDSATVLSSLLTLPFDELFESILHIISQRKELIKSNNSEKQIKEVQTNIILAIDLTLLLAYHIPFDSSIIEELRYRRSRIEENTILVWWSKQIMDLMLRANMFERIKGLILGVPP
jgi:hypothetical protein